MQAIEIAHAPVAQLDRVTDYESVGQGFESLPAYQNEHLRVFVLFYFLHALIAGAICDIMKINQKENEVFP